MAYSSVAEIRSDSGFTNNTDVTDAKITYYLNRANGKIIGTIAKVYDITELTGSNFTASPAYYLLNGIETMLASGYLLVSEFGAEQLDSDNNGFNKINNALDSLKAILEGNSKLIGVDETEFTNNSNYQIDGYPKGSSTEDDRYFNINDTY